MSISASGQNHFFEGSMFDKLQHAVKPLSIKVIWEAAGVPILVKHGSQLFEPIRLNGVSVILLTGVLTLLLSQGSGFRIRLSLESERAAALMPIFLVSTNSAGQKAIVSS